jgi:hypothetical protein
MFLHEDNIVIIQGHPVRFQFCVDAWVDVILGDFDFD